MKEYDVIIVGGGMVGASLAVALRPLNLKIALVDAFSFGQPKQPSYDDRAIALSYGSRLIYSGMGLWDQLQSGVTPIDKIHISDRGFMGKVRLTAKQEKLPALGYLVESRVLGGYLYDALKLSDIDLLTPAEVIDVQSVENSLNVVLKKETGQEVLGCQLLVAADGAHSKVREHMGVRAQRDDYQQVGVVANITPEKNHNNEAFERFTKSGPIALLPLSDNRCSLIWTHKNDDAEATLALNDEDFMQRLQQDFGYYLGRFIKVGERSSFPFALTQAKQLTATRTIVLGNASQALHPVAGQGLNLGLRDIAEVVELLSGARYSIGSPDMLKHYVKQRSPDRNTVIKYTDSLVKLFSNDSSLLGHARGAGLLAVDRTPFLRQWLVRQNTGGYHRKTRLARGLDVRVR